MIHASDRFITALKRPQKEVFVKLEFYDNNMQYIREYTKKVTKNDLGSISIDGKRPIRRSFSFSLDNSNGDFIWGEDKLIWLNKRCKLYIGLKLANGEIEYIPQGVFVITNPSDSHNLEGKKCNITGQDKAYLFTQKRGKFINQTTFATGTNIAQAIKTIAQANGENSFNFDDIDTTIPYEITYEFNDNRWNAMQELAQLAQCDIYYDVNGCLRLKMNNLNEFSQLPVTWKYHYNGDNGHFYAGNIRKMDESILANAIRVVGGSGQTATVTYDLIVDENDSNWTNSPYSIQQIGYLLYQHNNGRPDSLISTETEAKSRAKFELMKKLGYSEKVSLSLSPIYLHEAGDIIEIIDTENNVEGRYMIDSFVLPIIPSLMNVECSKEIRVIENWDYI